MREKVVKGLKYLHDVQRWSPDESAENITARRNITADAIALLKEPTQPTVPELKDLQVLRDVKSGKILKSGCKDYVIYNGDWYRQNRWDWPEKAQEPRLVTREDFQQPPAYDGVLPCWKENRKPTRRNGWVAIVYGKALQDMEMGVARYWTGVPTDEQREGTPWPSAENRDR